MKWASAARPRAKLLALPRGAVSLDEAHEAIELWEFYSRKKADPTQRLAVEVMMARDASGRWAARTTGREMCRQNGKGDEIEIVELWGLVKLGEAILHTAHELFTVSKAHERMVGLLSHRDLKRKVKGILNGVGQQEISFHNDAVIAYRTRTGGGGRGLDDISRIVVDEAQHAKAEQLASSSSTMLVNPNPQLNAIGTGGIAAKTTEFSAWWWAIRKRCLAGDINGFGYVGHTAEKVWLDEDGNVEQEAVDPTDERLWYAANPVLHTPRGDIEFFREELKTLGPDLFAREHLCVWDPPQVTIAGKAKIDPHWWRGCATRNDIVGPVVVAVDTTHDLGVSTVDVCGRTTTGAPRVEVVQHDDGSHWVELAMLDLLDKQNVRAVAFDASGPAKALRPMLERILADHKKNHPGADEIKLAALTSSRYQAACTAFVAAVKDRQVEHGSDSRLGNLAVSVPARRTGDDTWLWDRRVGDIGPLVAATCALAVADALPAVGSGSSVYEDADFIAV